MVFSRILNALARTDDPSSKFRAERSDSERKLTIYRIVPGQEIAVDVWLDESTLRWMVKDSTQDEYYSRELAVVKTFSLFDYRPLVWEVAERVMKNWQPPEEKEGGYMPSWIKTRVGQSIKHKLHPFWQDMIATLPEDKRRLHKALWNHFFNFGMAYMCPLDNQIAEVYNYPYLVRDLIKYRAAAIPLHHYLVTLRYGKDKNEFIERLLNWRYYYSHGEKPSRALNVTIDRMPGNIRYHHVQSLQDIAYYPLRRPLTNRTEYLFMVGVVRFNGVIRYNADVFWNATAAEIKRAAEIVMREEFRTINLRNAEEVVSFGRYLADFPEEHHGRLPSLAEKAVEWHRAEDQRREEERKDTSRVSRLAVNPETPLMPPPIPLPQDRRITFLDTVGALIRESNRMNHCVGKMGAGYRNAAIRGECFIFHVNYKGEEATVEVNSRGAVVQASGVSNRQNNASKWARKKLEEWGEGLRDKYITQQQLVQWIEQLEEQQGLLGVPVEGDLLTDEFRLEFARQDIDMEARLININDNNDLRAALPYHA